MGAKRSVENCFARRQLGDWNHHLQELHYSRAVLANDASSHPGLEAAGGLRAVAPKNLAITPVVTYISMHRRHFHEMHDLFLAFLDNVIKVAL